MTDSTATDQDRRYEQASAEHGAAIARVARAYEADPALREDLRQDIHVALWRSLTLFDGRCSLRTWVYRVAHNTAAGHVLRAKRARRHDLVSLDALQAEPPGPPPDADRRLVLDRLITLVRRLQPLDRQVITLYLEGEPAAAIAVITGLSAGNVAVKIHRIKALLGRRFAEGGHHVDTTGSR